MSSPFLSSIHAARPKAYGEILLFANSPPRKPFARLFDFTDVSSITAFSQFFSPFSLPTRHALEVLPWKPLRTPHFKPFSPFSLRRAVIRLSPFWALQNTSVSWTFPTPPLSFFFSHHFFTNPDNSLYVTGFWGFWPIPDEPRRYFVSFREKTTPARFPEDLLKKREFQSLLFFAPVVLDECLRRASE